MSEKHSTVKIDNPVNVFLNNTSTFDIYDDKISLTPSATIQTSNVIVRVGDVGYEWNNDVIPLAFDNNEFGTKGSNIILKSIPYTKFPDKESILTSNLVNIQEPVVTTSGEGSDINGILIPGTDYKYMSFPYSSYPILSVDATNLKAWYKFDGDYNDSSGSGYNLTNSGATIVDGLIDQSVSTDSTDFLSTNAINLAGKTYSISLWMKFNATPSNVNVWFFAQGTTSSNGKISQAFYESGANRIRFSHYGSVNDMDTTNFDAKNTIGTLWHHYTITYNNTTRNGEIWFDGVKLTTNISAFGDTFSGTGDFYIARSQVNGGTFNGLMEDFRYYDKVLTQAEINELYNINQTQYTVNFPVDTECDILIVGGGGGGDKQIGGGGGGGAVLHATNIKLPANTYTIKVGRGGAPNVNGEKSEAFEVTCLGGGSTEFVAWNTPNSGRAGGSGSGGSSGDTSTGTFSGGGVGTSIIGSFLTANKGITGTVNLYNGMSGGNSVHLSTSGSRPGGGGGGGGAGTVGKNADQVSYSSRENWIDAGRPSVGGDGVPINITGTQYYWGAGGGGGSHVGYGADGGLGGGGGGGSGHNGGEAGTGGISSGTDGNGSGDSGGNAGAHTGSGGGGSGFQSAGGNGGSGIVIIRYKFKTGSPETYYIKTPGILKYLPTSINTGNWDITEDSEVTYKSDFIFTLTKTTFTLDNSIYTTEFLFDPNTKFIKNENNYNYNINAYVISEDPTDKMKFCFGFAFFNNTSGAEYFTSNIIRSNNNNDWTITHYSNPTTYKKYIKISVKTVTQIESITVKI